MILGTITLNEVEHPIKLGTLAFSIYEDKTGSKTGFAVLSDKERLRSAKHLQALIYGAIRCGYVLQKLPCPITYDEVGAYIEPYKINEYFLAVTNTFDIPDTEEQEEIDKKKVMKAS